MSVEGGPSGGSSLGGISVVAPSMELASPITFFENNMKIASIITRFNSQSELNAADAISEAESILSQATKPQIGGVEVPAAFRAGLLDLNLDPSVEPSGSLTKPAVEPVIFSPVEPKIAPAPAPLIQTEDYVVTQTTVRPQTETKVSQIIQVSSIPDVKEQEIVKERKSILEEDTDGQTEVKNSEESSLLKIKIVEDVEASQKRKEDIRAAVKRLGGKGKIGRLVARLLSIRFWKSKSQIVGEGKDWTIDLTARSIESDTTEYKNEEEAVGALVGFVEKHIPVKEGEGGRGATIEEVRKVVHGEDREILKPQTSVPAEIVVKRVVKKRIERVNGIETVLEDKVDTCSEPNIEDLQLAAVFNKGLTDQNSLS